MQIGKCVAYCAAIISVKILHYSNINSKSRVLEKAWNRAPNNIASKNMVSSQAAELYWSCAVAVM